MSRERLLAWWLFYKLDEKEFVWPEDYEAALKTFDEETAKREIDIVEFREELTGKAQERPRKGVV